MLLKVFLLSRLGSVNSKKSESDFFPLATQTLVLHSLITITQRHNRITRSGSTLLQVSKSICILSGNLEAALKLDLDLKRLGFLKEVVSTKHA